MSAVGEEDVLHLQVAVDDVDGVEVLQRHHDLRELAMRAGRNAHVALGVALLQSVVGLRLHEGEQVAAGVVVRHQVDGGGVLEAKPELDNERAVNGLRLRGTRDAYGQQLPLADDSAQIHGLVQHRFGDDLHGVENPRIPLLAQPHLAVSPLADAAQQFKSVDAHGAGFGVLEGGNGYRVCAIHVDNKKNGFGSEGIRLASSRIGYHPLKKGSGALPLFDGTSFPGNMRVVSKQQTE